MNVFQTNVTLARAPDVAAVAAIQAGQSDLLVRQASVNAAREASQRQGQVPGTSGSEPAIAIDLEQRSPEERQRSRNRPAGKAPSVTDPGGRRPGFSPFGVGRRLDLVI